MSVELRTDDPATILSPSDASQARRVVFSWVLVPTAARLSREAAAGRDVGRAMMDLRTAVRLLDQLGWPGEGFRAARLSADQAEIVRQAARACRAHGLDTDVGVRARFARGPVGADAAGGEATAGLLERLERDAG